MVNVAVPSLPPLQLTLIEAALKVNAVLMFTEAVDVPLQPLVTVTV